MDESAKSRGWRASNFGVGGVGQKKDVSGVGRNFGVGRVGLRVLLKRYYKKFRKIYRKAPVLESLIK